ncbi:MAG: Dabb family protein [Nibricoccus sp.]
MLIHSVFFWLKPETTAAQRDAMQKGLESLRAIKSTKAVYVGTPAALPDRPTRDSSYAFALTVLFKDIAAHDAYQIDPLHKAFIQEHSAIWARVQVYDAL